MTKSRFLAFAIIAFSLIASVGCVQISKSYAADKVSPQSDPDQRQWVKSGAFKQIGHGLWETDFVPAAEPFDELIYSWDVQLPEREGFRLELATQFPDGSESPWLYGGYWGGVPIGPIRSNPTFDLGKVLMDQLLLEEKAVAFRFRIRSDGPEPLTTLPDLHVVTTDNSKELPDIAASRYSTKPSPPVFDLPLRAQRTNDGENLRGRCQSAAVATALEAAGLSLDLAEINHWTYDHEYNYPGIWPRTLGAATQQGYRAFIDRFRDWEAVRAALHENKIILCSIYMPKDGEYIDPPYGSMTGHIVALNGITDDGRVIVTDSAITKENRGYLCQWLMEDFEKVWFDTKDGVGMVVVPKDPNKLKTVKKLAAFPGDPNRKAYREDSLQ